MVCGQASPAQHRGGGGGGGIELRGAIIKAVDRGGVTFAVNFKMSADAKQSVATDPTKVTNPALLLRLVCCRFLFSQRMVSAQRSSVSYNSMQAHTSQTEIPTGSIMVTKKNGVRLTPPSLSHSPL
jgi:hypothetical protein